LLIYTKIGKFLKQSKLNKISRLGPVWMRFCIMLLLIVQSYFAFSGETLTIDSSYQEINLKDYCYHYEDTTNELSINEALKANWNKLTGILAFASNKYVQWIRYNLSNPYNEDMERVIFIPYHHIREIDVYVVTDSSIKNVCKTGIKRLFSDKHIKSIGYPIKIKLEPNQTISVILRLNHLYSPFRATSYLMTNDRVEKVILKNNSLIYFWRGIILFTLIFSLILYWFVRLKLFLYYFFLNMGVGLFIASQIGDYFLFFNIDRTDITSSITFTGSILVILFFPLLINSITPIKERNKVLWKWMYRFIYGMLVFYIITLFPPIRESKIIYFSHFYIMIVSALVFLLQLILLFKSLLYKERNAIPLFIIYSLYVLAVFTDVIFPNIGIAVDSPYVYNSLLIASFIEIFIFMIFMGREALNIYKDRALLLNKQQEHQKEMIVSMVKGQEEERNRAGRELHDSIGANMAIIKQKIGKENKELYKIVSQTIESVRNLSHGLVTPMVKKDEFIDELKEMCHLFSSDELEVHVYFHKWPEIDNTEITNHLYRITQELLQNAAKHSKAQNVYFQFIGENDSNLSLIYEDDGIGFNYSEIIPKGLGLKNIKNRVTLLNGSLQIDSSEQGKGTTIVIEVQY